MHVGLIFCLLFIYNFWSLNMKQLLGMAREKKQKQPVLKQTNNSLLKQKNMIQPQYQPVSEEEEQVGYEISEQELIAFAEFLGIQLPEQQDLLWIAEEGLTAQLPAGWTCDQTPDDGEVIYVNMKTGQQTYEHPCDEYYKQRVIQERRKRGGSKSIGLKKSGAMLVGPQSSKPFPGQSSLVQQSQLIPSAKQAAVDPLVKLQQQKQLKKLEQQKKRQFEDRKKDLLVKSDNKKQQLRRDLKRKEQQIAKRYAEQIRLQKEKQTKKMSQKQKQMQLAMNRQLKNYENTMRSSIQKEMQEKRARQKQLIEERIKNKKQEVKRQFENELRKGKRGIDEEHRERIKQLEQKEVQAGKSGEELDRQLQSEMKRMKNEIIRRKMKEHSQRIKQQNDREKEMYLKEVEALQKSHERRISQIQSKQPKNKVKLQQLIKQCEKEEKEDLQQFDYQLQQLRLARRYEKQQQIEQFRNKTQEQHRRMIGKIIQDYDELYEKYHGMKRQQYDSYIWQIEKKSKQQYLRTLKTLEKKYITEEEIALIENAAGQQNVFDRQQNNQLQSMLNNATWEQKQARRQLQGIKLQIENMRSQNISLGHKLNENQMKLYQLIQDKIKSKPN